jgi:CRP-like cAMP-binding protein
MDPVTNYCAAILGENQKAMSAIRLIPELSSCSDDLLGMIYAYSKTVSLQPGEVLIQEGLFDQWVYFVIQGELDVVINGEQLGSTAGPMVGERCILGDPRGANLVAGKEGIMALGVEMSIIDEINREINNFQQTASSDEEAQSFANERTAINLELLTIILNEVIERITNLYDSGISGANQLNESNANLTVTTKNLFEFSSDGSADQPTEDNGTTRQFLLYSFNDFSETVYYELLQKHLHEYGFVDFPKEEWNTHFIIATDGHVQIKETFDWLNCEFGISNIVLMDIATSIFEIASLYTTAANDAMNQVFSAFERERDKKKALESLDQDRKKVKEQIIAQIQSELFDPIDEIQNSASSDSEQTGPAKMSQDDIDALFG